jgi:hypothetical protein
MLLYICNQTFTGGSITSNIKFTGKSQATCCEIILSFDPATQNTLNVGIPAYSLPMFAVREYKNNKWNYIATAGDRESALEVNRDYEIKVTVIGSLLSLFSNGVEVLRTNLPSSYLQSQVGLFCIDYNDIIITKFDVKNRRPRAFVVMQFSDPFNDVYMEVIRKVCEELRVDVLRIDESSGPGLIIADISRAIIESTLVIADITPVNANVFYEVGYAHGLQKPTILIAERSTKLPFDVSPFRTLLYENSISGKPKLERGLIPVYIEHSALAAFLKNGYEVSELS